MSPPVDLLEMDSVVSGRFRKGVSHWRAKRSENVVGATPTSGHVNVRTECLEATPGPVKRLEISKEHIRECVTAWLLLLHFTAV